MNNKIVIGLVGIFVLLLASCDPSLSLIETATEIVAVEDDHDHLEETTNSSDDDNLESVDSAAGDDCTSFITSVFEDYIDEVTVTCDDNYYYVASDTGLPDHEIMRGITSWILRVPVPFDYTEGRAWRIARNPLWLDEHEATHARGPVAFGVNGVPIYHFDKRPDVNLGDGYVYDAKFDTVKQGELDHCGGHAGQGEDYHYHLAPICLLDGHDLSQPIGFTMGGAAIFYGTGADDYYGEGRFNDIDNLPEQGLDECNAIQLDDGSYVYYTTNTPPYVVGCHHALVNWQQQVEPRVIRELSEFGRNAEELLSFSQDGDVRTLLFRTVQGSTNAIVYYPADQGDHCWSFEFRANVNQSALVEIYCRPDL